MNRLPEAAETETRSTPTQNSKTEDAAEPIPWVRLVTLDSRALDHEMLWGAIALSGLFMVWILPPEILQLAPKCPFKEFTGHPCMSCGGTRALEALVHTRFAQALEFNPLAALAIACAAPYVLYAAFTVTFRTRRIRFHLRPPWSNAIRVALLALVVLNWTYLLWVGR